ncbi:MAG TPA: hypothetical protein VK750_07340 [Cytophagaceae bacterium]|jgi:hypothetical protein|nr:hypothetical protein [Cytophagaceae bacterium]
MTEHIFEVSIKAPTHPEAVEKLKAALTLMQSLKTIEIKKLADVVKNDPIKTAFAKKALGL